MLNGGSGEIITNRDDNHKAQLTLFDVDETLTYISDLPKRRAGVMLVETFIETWKEKSKGVEPPNAGFIFYEDSFHKYSDFPVKLSNPKYDDLRDLLQFDILSLKDPFPFNVKRVEEVSVFVDYFYSCEEGKKCYE